MRNRLTKILLFSFFMTALFYLAVVKSISYPLTTILKPLPIALLIVVVWQSAIKKSYKLLLTLALGFSLTGDVALTLPIGLSLILGIAFFLLAHCAYLVLFLKNYSYQVRKIVYFLPVLLLACGMGFYLLPHVGHLAVPVSIYIVVLTAMVFSAFQTRDNTLLLAGGACIFLLSDLSLACNEFIFTNSHLGVITMPTYYLAQFLLVLGIITHSTEKTTYGLAGKAQVGVS